MVLARVVLGEIDGFGDFDVRLDWTLSRVEHDQPDELAALTPQERKILMLVAEGKTNKEIAGEVFLSDKTVKNYVSSILSKLNLERRAQAAAFVAKHRLPGSE
jgi:DNA-binding NarL/FixJ family response regulator